MRTGTRASQDEATCQPIAYRGLDLDRQTGIYQRTLELRRNGLSYSRIVACIRAEYNASTYKSTISYWISGLHNPLGRVRNFEPVPSKELAYIIGVMKGDGSLNVKQDEHQYRIRLQSVDMSFVREFDRCISRVLNSRKHALWSGAGRREIHVEACSFLLHRFMKPLEDLKPLVEHCSDCTASFLGGFFDSEGCVDTQGSLRASNSDVLLLKYVQALLSTAFGIETTGPFLQTRKGTQLIRRGRVYFRNSNCYQVRVRNIFRLRFLKEIGFTISRKKVRLRGILDTGKRGVPYRARIS